MRVRIVALVVFAAIGMMTVVPVAAKPGDWTEVGDGKWGDATLMTGMDGALWIIYGQTLYKVSTK